MVKKTLFCAVFAILTGGGLTSAFAQRASIPATSSSDSPTYYVLRNANTGDYLYCNTGDHRIYHKALSNLDDGYLWWFEALGEGVRIGSKAAIGSNSSYYNKQGSYLLNTTYSGGYGNFDGTGSTWYLERTPYNVMGFTVTDGNGNYWKRGSGSTGYITPESFSESDKDYYVWIIQSYADLLEEATANGADVSSLENAEQTSANFKTLIQLINTTKSNSSTPAFADGNYLLLNRRHNLYLDGDGTVLNAVSSPTQNAVWQLTTTGGIRTLTNVAKNISIRVTDNSGHNIFTDPTASFSLDPTVTNALTANMAKSSDGDVRFISIYHVVTGSGSSSANLYFGLTSPTSSVSARSSQGVTTDWQLISVEDYLTETSLWGQDIQTMPTYLTDADSISEEKFYRIQNVARSYTNYNEDNPGNGGWLEDVDHQHIRADLGNTNAVLAEVQAAAGTSEFYCADKDMSHASALWQFVLVGHASAGGEEPTGVLSSEHNIYVLRNANTGKYIKNGVTTNGGLSFHQITTEKSEAQPFYITELADGEFAFWEYTGTSGEGLDQHNGALAIEGTGTGYRAGLTRAATATSGTASAWNIQEASQIRLNFVTTAANNNSNDNWTTFYYPFDAKPQASDAEGVEIYAGAWIKDDVQIGMVRMQDVPAGNAVMLRSETGGNFLLNIYPANSGQCTQTSEDFEGSCWHGIVESEGLQYNGKSAVYNEEWRNYWILGVNKKKDVRLLHPAGDWLLPNRAYLDAVTTQSTPSSVSMFVYFFDDRVTSVRDALRLIDEQKNGKADSNLYDLQGRLVTGKPSTGVYVRNGKKVYIR